jgi:Endosomal/lysosomal potassium channel TMEM175
MNQRHEEIASALPVELDSLPRLRGFRLRGMQMTRLETFIDAAFAFAISMLVIAAQQIPDNIQALLAAFKNVPTFVCSIGVLGIFWRGHWLWSRRYGLEDGASILISWTMIVTILIFIYPLKAIFGAMWYFLSDGQVGQPLSVHTTESQARTVFAIYALGLIAISAEICC